VLNCAKVKRARNVDHIVSRVYCHRWIADVLAIARAKQVDYV
jgi:hypothetical protein